MTARNPRDYDAYMAASMRGTREEVEVARDEASLTELGVRVVSDRNFLDQIGGENEGWIAARAQRAQQTAVERQARTQADRLPPVTPTVTLTEPETNALVGVLRTAAVDVMCGRSANDQPRSSVEVLHEVRTDLVRRLGRASAAATRATVDQREAHVTRAVKRYQQQLKAARTRRARKGRGGEGRSLDG